MDGLAETINDFIKKINELYEGEPLDGDETEELSNIVLHKLNEFYANN